MNSRERLEIFSKNSDFIFNSIENILTIFESIKEFNKTIKNRV